MSDAKGTDIGNSQDVDDASEIGANNNQDIDDANIVDVSADLEKKNAFANFLLKKMAKMLPEVQIIEVLLLVV